MASSGDPTLAEHEITQGAFAHLESAFESYRAADPQRDAYIVTSSTAVFDPLVVSTSVAWPIVLKALLGHFGTTDKSRREAVDPGRLGFARVMDVLRKTNGIAQDPVRSEAAEILLSRLHRAVMDRTAAFATAADSTGNAATPGLATPGLATPTPASTMTVLATAKPAAPQVSAALKRKVTPLLPTPPSTSDNDFASAFSVSHYANGQSATLAPDSAPSLFNDYSPDTAMADGPALDDNGVSPEPFRRRASAPSTQPEPKKPEPKKDLHDDEHFDIFSQVPFTAQPLRGGEPRRKSAGRAAASTASPAVASDADSDTGPRVTRRRAGKVARPNYREVVSSEEEEEEDSEEEEDAEEEEDDTDDDDLYAGPNTGSKNRSRVRTRTQIDLTSAGSSSEDEEAELTELALPKRSDAAGRQTEKRKQPEDAEKTPNVPTSKKPRTDAATTSTVVQEAGTGFDSSHVPASSTRLFSDTPSRSSAATAATVQPPRQSSQSNPPVASGSSSTGSAAPAPAAAATKTTSAASTASTSTPAISRTIPPAASATTTPAAQRASDASAVQPGPSRSAASTVQAGPSRSAASAVQAGPSRIAASVGQAGTPPSAAAASTTAVAAAAAAPARPAVSQSTATGRRIASLFPTARLPELASSFDASNAPNDRTFTRYQLGGSEQEAINRGTRPKDGKSGRTIYDSSRDHLTLQMDSNVCLPGVDAIGEPIVVLSYEAKDPEHNDQPKYNKMLKYKNALLAERAVGEGESKSRSGSHVLLSNHDGHWYDGTLGNALQLPYGPGASSRIDPHLRGILESRLKLKAPGNNFQLLRAWGWRLPHIPKDYVPPKTGPKLQTTSKQLWEELESGKIKPRIPFLVLKCVGFDQADFEVWKAAPRERPKK